MGEAMELDIRVGEAVFPPTFRIKYSLIIPTSSELSIPSLCRSQPQPPDIPNFVRLFKSQKLNY